MDIYRENILDHYRNPRNYGKLLKPDITQIGDNPLCGDSISIQIQVSRDKLTEIRFTGKGCAISMAATSMLTEHVQEMNLSDLRKLSKDDILELLGTTLSPTRLKCALLPVKTLQIAVNAVSMKKGG
ncbi:Fe-S cluster protein [Candidatus Roizmanbacteria bacterium CG22_combo_CG10-13_8_21_14_all_38_20]|uniref:Fe-S cluster protein n=1 Tax=Candidatus Roizmanbacteria bacterium CG22_combo_CG10-13_8_21_14_all_38_20 TaxID=1974862 RepID=A0A2H0BVF0_9BACT|nr:iron-sulfur cluster assembly scaffold protein [Candidatus Microgenomates bacterium]PIP61655.1 MAG: Fe-S cluster protein [Candidatus Roizmanbacteria bacterium CG22_combo_CG10-13_8_21_14_all_38_20]PJC30993.1 MAG: Fe-S cluster protein [Candidatus Roizmanbacteria bacterium CG_4_9_14_0_2_um_filter_38_17]